MPVSSDLRGGLSVLPSRLGYQRVWRELGLGADLGRGIESGLVQRAEPGGSAGRPGRAAPRPPPGRSRCHTALPVPTLEHEDSFCEWRRAAYRRHQRRCCGSPPAARCRQHQEQGVPRPPRRAPGWGWRRAGGGSVPEAEGPLPLGGDGLGQLGSVLGALTALAFLLQGLPELFQLPRVRVGREPRSATWSAGSGGFGRLGT